MADKSDFLWGMYQEHRAEGRHHEVQRANVSNFIIIVAGGVLAFVASKDVTRDKWILAVFLIIVGLFGALFSAKQSEKVSLQMTAGRKYRHELEELLTGVSGIRSAAESEHEKKFPLLMKVRLHYFWIALHLLIAILGAVLLAIALSK